VGNQREAIRIVHAAIDRGITFMDNAWEYNEGESEEIMGRRWSTVVTGLPHDESLHPRPRPQSRHAQLTQSLKRLKTDHLDLWQVHECVYPNDPEHHFASGGVIEALVEAKERGLVRYVGFTGHKLPEIHLEMLSHGFPFDSVQMPLNCFDASFRSFEQAVLPEARRQGLAILGMKSMGGEGDAVRKARRDGRGGATLRDESPGDDDGKRHRLDAGAASERAHRCGLCPDVGRGNGSSLRARVAGFCAADGRFELYKTTAKHEADVGRKQHGFPLQDEVAAYDNGGLVAGCSCLSLGDAG
jgi:aryl-alcohol dehydrogenase-like predicted oxidoreductase